MWVRNKISHSVSVFGESDKNCITLIIFEVVDIFWRWCVCWYIQLFYSSCIWWGRVMCVQLQSLLLCLHIRKKDEWRRFTGQRVPAELSSSARSHTHTLLCILQKTHQDVRKRMMRVRMRVVEKRAVHGYRDEHFWSAVSKGCTETLGSTERMHTSVHKQ